MDLHTVTIDKPDAINFILGQTHFIKTVEDIHEALVPFSVYSDSAADDVVRRSRTLAEVYGIEYVIASDSVKGATYGASAAAGVPCILAEAGQVGQLDEENTQIHLEGCRNVLRHWGVLPGDPEPVTPIKLLQEFSWLCLLYTSDAADE